MEVKRVDVNFKIRRGQTWPGYENPHKGEKCKQCKGDGLSPFARLWADKWYGNAPFRPFETGSTPFAPTHPAFQKLAQQNAQFWVMHMSEIYQTDFWFCPECGAHCPKKANQFLAFCPNHDLIVEMVLNLPFEAALKYEQQRLAFHFNKSWQHHLNAADVQCLIEADRLWEFTRRPLNSVQAEDVLPNGWLPYSNGYVPTPAEVNVWSLTGFGHDSLNQMYAVRGRCKQAGYDYLCRGCAGQGRIWKDKATQMAYENWTPVEPPAGEGWQLWNNQKPLTRVYKKVGWLAKYAAKNLKTFADQTASQEEWRVMIEQNFIHHTDQLPNGRTMIFMT